MLARSKINKGRQGDWVLENEFRLHQLDDGIVNARYWPI